MVLDVFAGCDVKWVEWSKFHWVQFMIWTRTLYGAFYGWIPWLYNLIGWVVHTVWIIRIIDVYIYYRTYSRLLDFVVWLRSMSQSSSKEFILFGCCFNFRTFQLFRIIFIVIDFSLGIVYSLLSVHDASSEHRLPNTDFYSIGPMELAMRNG